MRVIIRQICLIGLLIVSTPALAYDPRTHADLSAAAVNQSVLAMDSPLLPDLGLKPFSANQQFFISSLTGRRTIIQHIRNGANIEDSFIRSLNHFYNPLTQRSLLGVPSPSWALEDRGDIDDQSSSFKGARGYFYHAMTSSDADEREKYFGLTFETLGNVIHHPQDMAQPQHVRDDEHCDIFLCKVIGRHNPSAYESYVFNLAKPRVTGYPSIFTMADPTSFTTARNLWTTSDGKGIADYTNRNFVSAGTNFRGTENDIQPAPGFPSPNGLGAVIEKRQITDPDLRGPKGSNQPLEGAVYFIQTPVKDNLTGESVLARTSTFSIFDADLMQAGQEAVFSLNEYIYKAASDLLTNRAVAYSAGLIDYFFRGRLEAEDADYTDTGIALRVRNAIDSRKTPAWKEEILKNGGTLVLVSEYKPVNGANNVIRASSAPVALAEDLQPGKTSRQMYSFSIPEIPDDAAEVKYWLVYRGQLGQEDGAVAVGRVEPTSGFLVTPSATPPDGIAGTRLIYHAWGKWRLSKQSGLRAGNIDWKGDYVNGKPTKTLTWQGPPARYFPLVRGYPFSEEIYRRGKVYAVAPLPVLGAAITRDDQGDSWLIAVCSDGTTDVVYRRPNKASNSPVMHDPQTNPEGWKEIGSYPGGTGYREANRPWFFNASGTQAVTLREVEPEQDPTLISGSVKTVMLELQLSNAAIATIVARDNGTGWNRVKTAIYNSTDSSAASSLIADGSGRYVVGVDYRENTLVTCDLRLEESENSNASWTAGSSYITYKGQTQGRYRQTLECGGTAQDLWDEQFDGQLAVTSGPVGVREKTYRLKYVSIDYADARYGLIVAGEKEISEQESCIDANGQSKSIYKENDLITHGSRRMATFVFEYPSNQTYCDLPYDWVSGFNYGTISQRFYPTLYVGFSLTDGDWLIDQRETLLTSQTRGANHYDSNTGRVGTGEFYNRLDGADLGALFGNTASTTSYFPVWVVH